MSRAQRLAAAEAETACRLARIELEQLTAHALLGPLAPEQRDGFVWLRLELPDGHGLSNLEATVLRYLASLQRFGAAWPSLEHVARIGKIVAAYRADLAVTERRKAKREKRQICNPPHVSSVPVRRLRSVFERLRPLPNAPGSGWLREDVRHERQQDGRWTTTVVRAVAGVDLANVDPHKPVAVPMPLERRPGRGGKQWSPTAAGWSRDERGRLIKPSGAPSKPAPVTVETGSGESSEKARQNRPPTVEAGSRTSSLSENCSPPNSPSENVGRCAPDLLSSESETSRQRPDQICGECFAAPGACDCRPAIHRTDRDGQHSDELPEATEQRPRTSSTTESTPTATRVGASRMRRHRDSRAADLLTSATDLAPDPTTREPKASAPGRASDDPETQPHGCTIPQRAEGTDLLVARVAADELPPLEVAAR